MPFSLTYVEDQIIASLREDIFPNHDVYEQAIPDIQTVERSSTGEVVPYITFQLGDPQPWGTTSFVGPRGDDYVLPVMWQAIVPTPADGRALRGMGLDRFLGLSFDWAGQIRKRVSGGQFPLKNSDGAVEAYIFPASFGIVTQLVTIPVP